MNNLLNPFKQALAEKWPQIGLWLGLADAYSAECRVSARFVAVRLDTQLLAQHHQRTGGTFQQHGGRVAGQPDLLKQKWPLPCRRVVRTGHLFFYLEFACRT